MLRNLVLLCLCLALLALGGCGGLNRKAYRIEKDKNEISNVIIHYGAGDEFYIPIPPPPSGGSVEGSMSSTASNRSGVKYSYEIKYRFEAGAKLKVLSLKFNGEEIPPEPTKAE